MSDAMMPAAVAAAVSILAALISNFGAEGFKRQRDAAALAGALAREMSRHAFSGATGPHAPYRRARSVGSRVNGARVTLRLPGTRSSS